MGQAKAWMMEQQELEDYGALIEFNCPNEKCKSTISEYVTAPVAHMVAEKQSEISQSTDTEVVCGACESVYTVTVTNDSAIMDAELDSHSDVLVHVEPPQWFSERDYDDEYWLYETSDNPQLIYKEACDELDLFIDEQCTEDYVSFKNRMALTQAWSIFETYLADELATCLAVDTDALIRFARNDEAIKSLQFDAVKMLEQNLSTKDEIIRAIKARLYHKFDKKGTECSKSSGVPRWFGIGLKINIEPDTGKLDSLRQFALLRHDCVHRNGNDREGNPRHDILKSKIVEMRNLMDGIVTRISEAASKQSEPTKF